MALPFWVDQTLSGGKVEMAHSMADEKSIVKKAETAIDDFRVLWNKRPGMCVVVLLILLAPSLFLVFSNLWGKGAIEKENLNLKSDLHDTKEELQSKEAQLAPFLAVANQRFSNEPPDKRLDLTLEMMHNIDKDVHQLLIASTNTQTNPYVLTEEAIARIKQRMMPDTNTTINFSYSVTDAKAFKLATQIQDLFSSQGFKIGETSGETTYPPRIGIWLIVKSHPSKVSPAVLRPLSQIYSELRLEPTYSIQANMPESAITIAVGLAP
jgi:hypothetical protein